MMRDMKLSLNLLSSRCYLVMLCRRFVNNMTASINMRYYLS